MLSVKPNILIELDALFDTVGGTLNRMGVDVLPKAIANGYFTRRKDEFYGVDTAAFRKLYAERDAATLALSMTTNIVVHLQDIITQNNRLEASSPWTGETTVFVNVHHYDSKQPMPDRVKNLIYRGLISILVGKFKVEIVSFPMTSLSLRAAERDYGNIFLYNSGEWQDHISSELEEFSCPNLGVRIPALHWGDEPISPKMDEEIQEVELMWEPFYNLEYLPIEFFSQAFNPQTAFRQSGGELPKVKGWDQ